MSSRKGSIDCGDFLKFFFILHRDIYSIDSFHPLLGWDEAVVLALDPLLGR